MEYVAFDSHKRYTFASVEEHAGAILRDARIEYQRGAVKEFLSERKEGTPEAIETIGNWHWIVDEIDKAGMVPQLDHARRAKMMLVSVNKTDKLLVGRGDGPVRRRERQSSILPLCTNRRIVLHLRRRRLA